MQENNAGRPPLRKGGRIIPKSIGLFPEEWRAMQERARREGKSVSQVVREAWEAYQGSR